MLRGFLSFLLSEYDVIGRSSEQTREEETDHYIYTNVIEPGIYNVMYTGLYYIESGSLVPRLSPLAY